MATRKPTETQLETLRRMALANLPIVRRPGGFWCIANDATDTGLQPKRGGEWSISNGTQVVRALENAGWIKRTNRDLRAWCDPRELTEAGSMVYEEAALELAIARSEAKRKVTP